jgi:antitoxin VapB
MQREDDQMPIHRDDDPSILKPVKRKDLLEVLAGLQPLAEEDRFPKIDDTLLPAKDIDL